jgi:hypothetical protein
LEEEYLGDSVPRSLLLQQRMRILKRKLIIEILLPMTNIIGSSSSFSLIELLSDSVIKGLRQKLGFAQCVLYILGSSVGDLLCTASSGVSRPGILRGDVFAGNATESHGFRYVAD